MIIGQQNLRPVDKMAHQTDKAKDHIITEKRIGTRGPEDITRTAAQVERMEKGVERLTTCIAEGETSNLNVDRRRSAGMFSACNSTFPGAPHLVASWALGKVESFPQALGASRTHSKLACFFHFSQYRVHSGVRICSGDRSWNDGRPFWKGWWTRKVCG